MQIQFKGNSITCLSHWKELIFNGKKEKHWKEGRSAYSLADFIFHRDGLITIKNLVAPALNEEFNITSIQPEYEARFDKFGHGREHDLAIWGTTVTGKKLFIGIESKVDETFGDTIGTAYIKAKTKELNGKKTNAPKRIERLLATTFPNVLESDFNLRYQLLFSTAGTLCINADIHILLILVFKTNLYNPELGKFNFNDLKKFLQRVRAEEKSKEHYCATINNNKLHIIYKEIE